MSEYLFWDLYKEKLSFKADILILYKITFVDKINIILF